MTVIKADISKTDFPDQADKRRANAVLYIAEAKTCAPVKLKNEGGYYCAIPVISDSEGVFPDVYIDHNEFPRIRVEVRDGLGDIVYIMDDVSVVDSYDRIPECEVLA